MVQLRFYERLGKRFVDLLASICGLIVVAPLFLAIAVAVKVTSRGPVFFRQVRVGQFEEPFRIFKFRSMSGSASGPGALLTASGDPRITIVGRWLRKSKLDELPQLINVLLGEMSLVGPRPEVPQYTAAYTDRQRQVLQARPGITGPAAIGHVREEELLAVQADKLGFYLQVLMPAKLEIDLKYCSAITFQGDVRLILATLASIFGKTRLSGNPSMELPEKAKP